MSHVRVTPDQAKLLFDNRAAADGQPKPVRAKREPRPKRTQKEIAALPENILEKQISDFLRIRGWTVERNHVGTFIPAGTIMRLLESGQPLTKESLFRSMVRIGLKGKPDYTAFRFDPVHAGHCQYFYFETKAPGKGLRPEQKQWWDNARALHLTGDWFNDFDFGGKHSFLEFYAGLFGA